MLFTRQGNEIRAEKALIQFMSCAGPNTSVDENDVIKGLKATIQILQIQNDIKTEVIKNSIESTLNESLSLQRDVIRFQREQLDNSNRTISDLRGQLGESRALESDLQRKLNSSSLICNSSSPPNTGVYHLHALSTFTNVS